jgi:hypothetical protein
MEDSLFFLEQLNRYFGYIKKAAEYADKIVPLSELEFQEDEELIQKSNNINQALMEQALYDACYVLQIILEECVPVTGSFQINIPVSCISGSATGFESSAIEGKQLLEQILKELQDINTLKEKKVLAKQLKSQIEGTLESQNASPLIRMINITNKVNSIFNRMLPGMIGVEGIQQVVQKTGLFLSTVRKWEADKETDKENVPPQLWSKEQELLVKKMQKAGAILSEWLQKNKERIATASEGRPTEGNQDKKTSSSKDISSLPSPRTKKKSAESKQAFLLLSPRYSNSTAFKQDETEGGSSKRVLPLLSPRYTKEKPTTEPHQELALEQPLTRSHSRFSLFSKKTISLPAVLIENAKKLREVTVPPTYREMQIYNQTVQYIESLEAKDKKLQHLKKDIAECTSESVVHQATKAPIF